MGKIFKNMLPYWKWIIVIIIFLGAQAYCDLSLPEYTANIIDVGITSKGVEHILPEKITKEDYVIAQMFMTEDEKAAYEAAYEESASGDNTLALSKSLNSKQLNELDDTLIIPILISYQATVMAENVQGEEAAQFEQMMQMAGMSGGVLPEEIVTMVRDKVQTQVDAMGTGMVKSMGVQFAAKCDEKAGVDMNKLQMNYLWKEGAIMLLFAIIMTISAIVVGYCASRVGAGVGRDLREKTFGNVVAYSSAEMDKFSTASLITRSTNDVQQVQMVSVLFLRMVLFAPIMGIGGIVKVAQAKSGMEWVIAVAVAALLIFVGTLVAIAMPKFKIMQTLVDRLNLVSREILTGLSVIRAFGREQREEERFDDANRNLTRTQLFTNRVMTFMFPGMSMVMYGMSLLIVWVAAGRIDAGTMQVGTMTAFITYTMMIVMSFLMLTAMSIMLPRAGVAAERIDEVIKTTTSIVEKNNQVISTDHAGVVEFKNVFFRYPGAKEDVLEEISFLAEPGKTTAIIGSTGCGKSTLVNLIPRFYDVKAGEILLDGVDIRDYSLKELRDTIGFVPQKGVLFSGTIASNLRFGKEDASDEEIREAAEIAQAIDFIEEKKDKFEDSISQGGGNVSGGQKQRLAIARAIAKDPRIYVFDDSFSALDMKTDAKLRKALEEKTNNATVIIVAQRISTIIHADQILVLDDGKIVGRGTHEELLKNCDVYMQIATSQLSAKELGLDVNNSDGKEEN